jgi:hypothetical protein
MTCAEKILTVSDRTPKERRDMADFYGKRFDWHGDLITYWFEDNSALMMTLDENLRPIEMVSL